jgi:hypothetical protein
MDRTTREVQEIDGPVLGTRPLEKSFACLGKAWPLKLATKGATRPKLL